LRTGWIEALRAFEVGEVRLQRYQIEKELGSGATGIVYRARDVEEGRIVAIKRLYPHLARNPLARERFCTEAGLLRQLHSAYVVSILDLDEEEEPPILAMEYLPGGLDRMLADREGEPLPPLEAARIVAQISRGLADALTAGIVHRDVKPSNVLLSAEGIPKVTDFGIARAEAAFLCCS
ncbi:MAG: serine/threonine protein kinase, partial [Gemmatimonadetes bacterium]|nr:serine/threonine protein kinase [Gemmatimonadota bacterium]